MMEELKSNHIEINRRKDGLYTISTEQGIIGTVMFSQLEKAVELLKTDKYGTDFYNKLND